MGKQIGRRKFLKGLGTGAAVLIGAACAPAAAPTAAPTTAPAPTAAPKPAATTAPAAPAATTAPAPAATVAAKPAATAAMAQQGDRLVVAIAGWGIETPFAWRSSQSEKPLWDVVYDPLIMRDAKTFGYLPGLATSWTPSADYKTWTFKLRQGVMFHDTWGELTGEDVKFTVEQNLKPDSQGGSAPFFRSQLDGIDLPDKYTVVMRFKTPVWEVPSHFAQFNGYQNITSKKYLESVGEDKAAQRPIGSGPFKYVDGKQGDFHRFAAVANHWRQTPGFKEIVIRRIPDPATRLAGVRAGEIDIAQVTGDYLAQAKKAGLRIHEQSGTSQYWIVLPGLVTPEKEDYCPKCAWVGDPADPKSLENAKKVRLALNLAVNKKAIIDNLWAGYGAETPYSYWYYPFNKGYSQNWKVPPYDPARAKQLLAEAGFASGFEIKVAGVVQTVAVDGKDVMEAIALDWEKIGITVKRVQIEWGDLLPKVRARKTGVVGWPYGSLPFDEPALVWQRGLWSKGTFHLLGERVEYDKALEAMLQETDPDKRTKMQSDLGQKLYDDYMGVMIGMKSSTWAVSKKVGNWPTLAYAGLESNYEYITPAG